MSPKGIFLFMWGYQHIYRISLKILAERVFATLGVQVEPNALLVGVRRPESENPNPVCVEPEDGQWPLELFSGLLASVETIVGEHPLQRMFYGDEPSMRDKPENIRRDSVRSAVKQALAAYDAEHDVRSFCGMAYPVDEYHVVPVVQVPEHVFKQFPPLNEDIGDNRSHYQSFVHAAMGVLLGEATAELQLPEPGRGLNQHMRTADEIVRHAATDFMRTPGLAIEGHNFFVDLFAAFNLISSLMYERTKGTGRLLLVNPASPAIQYALRLAAPVSFREPRWVRKVLQMASTDLALIADCEAIHGLGRLDQGKSTARRDVFTVVFLDHYHWDLRCGSQILLRSRYGEPKLPQEPITCARFIDNFARLFPESSSADHQKIWDLFTILAQQDHGSMIVVASDAVEEARRLAQQGSIVQPVSMTEELLRSVSKIDGTIILDPHSVCHAVGVILDGPANDECTPSRGSRYNSGIRYVQGSDKSRLAIVVSDDRTVDLIPLLRERIDSTQIERSIEALERATLDNYHQARNFLDDHRFYLNEEQCKRTNAALDRIENLPKEVGELVMLTSRFKPHPEMNDSYYN